MTQAAIKTLCKALAVVMFACGAFGSMLCVPYAIGFDLSWITAAGVYFIAGAIMMSGGLITYTAITLAEK
ncbi:MAG: hypothetical protein HQL20_07885 [Candidatus Omnitrophica bacterium]|nr:hypothetical protein [Candidatus Omnitrophota bacterium]